MTWSADVVADDWRHINASEVVRRAIARLDEKGKGILLLHDIQPATALALPELLRQLKMKGYRIVHVVPGKDEMSVPVAVKANACDGSNGRSTDTKAEPYSGSPDRGDAARPPPAAVAVAKPEPVLPQHPDRAEPEHLAGAGSQARDPGFGRRQSRARTRPARSGAAVHLGIEASRATCRRRASSSPRSRAAGRP